MRLIETTPLLMVRLVEHPGHPDQKVHGRKGAGPDHTEQLSKLDAELRTIRGAERIVAIDPKSGKVVFDKGADGAAIELTYANDVAIAGTIATHNHPIGWDSPAGSVPANGSSFSKDDMATAWRTGVAEMRVAAPGGTYTLKNKSDPSWGVVTRDAGKPDTAHKAGVLDMTRENALHELNIKVETKMWSHINDGTITPVQAGAIHGEILGHAAAAKFGWDYSLTRTSSWADPGVDAADFAILTEARLLEHPGHGDQKSHGRRGGVDVEGTKLGNISEATKAKMTARAEALGVPSIDDQAAAIGSAYEKATDAQRDGGMGWYEDAHDSALTMSSLSKGKVSFEAASAVVALNSPTRHWDVNKAVSIELTAIHAGNKPFKVSAELGAKARPPIKAGTYKPSDLNSAQMTYTHPRLQRDYLNATYDLSGKGYGRRTHNEQLRQSEEVLRGNMSPDQALGGVKIRNFYNNIYDPRNSGVTVDDWAYKAALGEMPVSVRYTKSDGTRATYSGPASGAPYGTLGAMMQISPTSKSEGYKAGLYPITAEAYTRAAAKYGIAPHQMQAVVWNVTREASGTPDVEG